MAAEAWLEHLFDAIADLAHFPKRHPVSESESESESESTKAEVRTLIFGNYLVFFRVI